MNSLNMPTTERTPANIHPAFEWKRSVPVPALNVVVEEYRHRVTGAQHIHIASDNSENVFLVALRTVPEDSTGVAHILEHTALCGSAKYPVRDPFFMMTRRSLNTFMNAFTSSDWTAYPFASQNRKDYFNLLDVYLDAVFFANLDEMDFAQEGHRLEFEEADNPQSPLQFKGVVYNEMKGAMSSIGSTLWQTLTRYLFPTTTYHYNSGGDPEHIPDLSYEELREFYRTHYQPGNAVFMTYGDIPADELHARFEERALGRFEPMPVHIEVPDEKRYHAPLRVQEAYAWQEEDAPEAKTHIVLGWLLGKSTDLGDLMRAHLLNGILLDNSASPLQLALETTTLGSAPSPLCGLEDSHREIVFVCGIEGSEADRADEVEAMVMDTLKKVAEEGVPIEQVRSVLHQLELHQREIGGDGYPFGLQMIFMAMAGAVHRGDCVATMDIKPVLEQLQKDIEDPEFIKTLVRDLLLENTHRVRLVMTPDTELAHNRDAAERARLDTIRAGLDEHAVNQIVETAAALKARQEATPDDSCLPKVTIADVPAQTREPSPLQVDDEIIRKTVYSSGTNGIVYLQLVVDLPALAPDLLELLPYYSDFITELGHGEHDYLSVQVRQAAVTGGISAYASLRGAVDDEQSTRGVFVMGTRALARNSLEMSSLLRSTFEDARFDETQRVRELISQKRARRDQAVTGSGHSLAMMAASAGMSPVAQLTHRQSGLEGIRHTRALEKAMQNSSELDAFVDRLRRLHECLKNSRSQVLLIADDDNLDTAKQSLVSAWSGFEQHSLATPLHLDPVRERVTELWQASTQVHFCAKAYPTVPSAHPDAAALTVLGGFLRNGYLHRAIREQGGAYGGGATHDPGSAAFRFYSYRDPHHIKTLEAFDKSINWLLETEHQWSPVEEAILGVISSLDKPGSPAGEAKRHFHDQLFGRTPETRRAFRQRVLEVTASDLQRVASTYLREDKQSVAVLSNADGVKELKKHPTLSEATVQVL